MKRLLTSARCTHQPCLPQVDPARLSIPSTSMHTQTHMYMKKLAHFHTSHTSTLPATGGPSSSVHHRSHSSRPGPSAGANQTVSLLMYGIFNDAHALCSCTRDTKCSVAHPASWHDPNQDCLRLIPATFSSPFCLCRTSCAMACSLAGTCPCTKPTSLLSNPTALLIVQ